MQVRINETNLATIKEMADAEVRSIPFITNRLVSEAIHFNKATALPEHEYVGFSVKRKAPAKRTAKRRKP